MAWKKKNVITLAKTIIFINSRNDIKKNLKYRNVNVNFRLVLIRINKMRFISKHKNLYKLGKPNN